MLRLADIVHLDQRRAPVFLKAVRNPTGEAALHWTFQSKLHQVQGKQDRLLFTGQSFSRDEAAAWWLCCDFLRLVDTELRQVDNLNVDLNRNRFSARAVFGVEHPELLARHIPTEDWLPIDAHIQVTDLASLVKKLGGRELYGDDGTVPLRELIQNATDAIRARRVLERRSANWGDVTVRLGKDKNGAWIEVEDNGVGMSQAVLTGPFLDFGASFWATPDAVRQFPSLLSRGFESTGKYGIGFFSVFMWGERVRVTTRRYDEAQHETRVLEFENAMKSRPLLRKAHEAEFIRDGGIIVRVWPRGVGDIEKNWIGLPSSLEFVLERKATPIDVAHWLCPSLDANLLIESDAKNGMLLAACDWQTLPGDELIRRTTTEYPEKLRKKAGENVRELYRNGVLVGRASVMPGSVRGAVTVGGLRSLSAISIAGILLGESVRTSREEAELLVSDDELGRWASEQAALIPNLTSDPEERAECARLIGFLGGDIGELPVAKVGQKWLNIGGVAKWVSDKRSIFAITSSTYSDAVQKGYGGQLRNNVIAEPHTAESILHRDFHQLFTFRQPSAKKRKKPGIRPLLKAFAEGWSIPVDQVEVWRGDDLDIGDGASFFVNAEEIRRPEYDE